MGYSKLFALYSQHVTTLDPTQGTIVRGDWFGNAGNEVVTFAFDRRDRLVGQVRHPADYLDAEELELYVTELARECSRFAYLLTGHTSS